MGYRGELWVNDTPVSADWKVNVGRNFMILDKMIKLGMLSKKEFDKFEHTPGEQFNASIELTKKDTAKLIDDILEPIVKKLEDQRTAEQKINNQNTNKTIKLAAKIEKYESKYIDIDSPSGVPSGEDFANHVLKLRINKKRLKTYLRQKQQVYERLWAKAYSYSESYETTDLAYFTRIIRLLRTAMKRKGKINLFFCHG